MRHHPRRLTTFACTAAVLVAAATLTAQYSLTVNKDRLINAANEPQNWLLMNGDYGSLRYSRLTQINRENVKNMRMVWAMALGGMQDVGQNGPENEINPLIDNGFMYTSDGWGTIYKIDAAIRTAGKFAWVADPGRAARRQHLPHARHRALGRQGHRQPA
jgi:alcohol dehydrogenase (cytochrome c)